MNNYIDRFQRGAGTDFNNVPGIHTPSATQEGEESSGSFNYLPILEKHNPKPGRGLPGWVLNAFLEYSQKIMMSFQPKKEEGEDIRKEVEDAIDAFEYDHIFKGKQISIETTSLLRNINLKIKYGSTQLPINVILYEYVKWLDGLIRQHFQNKEATPYLKMVKDKILSISTLPSTIENKEEVNIEETVRLIAWMAWKGAANAYRMYPDNKHTFSDYWSAAKTKFDEYISKLK